MDWGYKLVPEGFGNCSFDLLAELSSDISSTKRNISLTFKKSTKKLLLITSLEAHTKRSVVLTLKK